METATLTDPTTGNWETYTDGDLTAWGWGDGSPEAGGGRRLGLLWKTGNPDFGTKATPVAFFYFDLQHLPFAKPLPNGLEISSSYPH